MLRSHAQRGQPRARKGGRIRVALGNRPPPETPEMGVETIRLGPPPTRRVQVAHPGPCMVLVPIWALRSMACSTSSVVMRCNGFSENTSCHGSAPGRGPWLSTRAHNPPAGRRAGPDVAGCVTSPAYPSIVWRTPCRTAASRGGWLRERPQSLEPASTRTRHVGSLRSGSRATRND